MALAALAFIWGYGWVVGKVALGFSGPFTFAAVRTALAAVALLCLLPATGRSLRPPDLRFTALVGLLQTSCFAAFSMAALSSAGAGRTVVLIYVMPFALLLISWTMLRESLSSLQRLSVALALPGFLLIVAPWDLRGLLPSLLTIAAGIAWAGSAVVVKLWQRHETVDALSLTAWQTVVGTVPLVVLALIAREPAPDLTVAFAATLAYNALIANGLGWLLWLIALQRLPAGVAGIGTLAVPVVGIISAWAQLGERPGRVEAIGMAMIVVGLALNAARDVRSGSGARRWAPERKAENASGSFE